jgi:diguanylate cyclase (GGDEF)-like protein
MESALTPASFQYVQRAIAARFKDFQNGQREFFVDELEQTCKDGSTVWTEVTTNFQINSENGHTEIYGVSRDITERKLNERLLMQANIQLHNQVKKIEQLRAELHEQAIRDPLTGLYNRRYLNEALEREFSRAEREMYQVSILIMDIDHFKIINDTHGHQLGDKFLIAIADFLKNNSRGSDIACRYGGEEFILVLPGTETHAAYARAEHFRAEFAQIQIPHKMKDLSITVSMGVASYPIHAAKPEDLIVKADLALYQSKHNGRNRVTIWGEAIEKSGS